ncbi:MAG: 23S rRNA (guanosine(2251)-2'-O)-methyltransferase RlmB, partial [Candidatus Sedimenticola sp. (ex Thyasira tokunagai)]
QGAVARTRAPTALDEKDLKVLLSNIDHPPFLLILDGVQDPHNLGACLRSADGAGVDAVIAPKDRSSGLTPVACKVASGAAENLSFFQVTNLSRTLKSLQDEFGIWLVGTEGEAETTLYDADLKGPLGIVMGGEEKGMRRLTGEQCDLRVSLPMAGSVESLNVSVAAGICLFEAVRQRQ